MDEDRLIFRVATEDFDIVIKRKTVEITSFYDKEKIVIDADKLSDLMRLLNMVQNERVPF